MKKRESLDEIIETLDPMVEPDYRVLRLFFLSRCERDPRIERGLYDKAIKPESIVVGGTDIVAEVVRTVPTGQR